MKQSRRSITSLFMAAIYLLLTGLPLAPLALHSKQVAHAVTGECSGDCGICGCAPERSAARACCCWQKKLARNRMTARTAEKSCCNKKAVNRSLTAAPRNNSDCGHVDQDRHEAHPVTADDAGSDREESVVNISTCPCGSGKHLLLGGTDNVHHLPSIHAGGIPHLQKPPYASYPPDRLTSHHGEPPDPPPKRSTVA